MALSVEVRQKIFKLLDERHAATQIAKHVGVSVGSVYSIKREIAQRNDDRELATVRGTGRCN